MLSALQAAIVSAGGAVSLGARLGITYQAVSQWKVCPPLRVLDVERASGVSRHDLRPDLYPRRSRHRARRPLSEGAPA
ncbi:helix-turn-helix domain-containing protein [Aureimonas fodinaquatilis]|uniref:Helix-turn-helix domain-containing protein n=1 Tax=Aureimonas fodinaquatilis TaxID=2565783 RepID=A0A5B0DZN0_9HYPH|nr:Cro/CI family transcriptional regulator [Aureimonas fodinaquatilis]KAA0971211.1 helix-turn-helix domain-containing protein [Aureimonas fodinaquatilis]